MFSAASLVGVGNDDLFEYHIRQDYANGLRCSGPDYEHEMRMKVCTEWHQPQESSVLPSRMNAFIHESTAFLYLLAIIY